MTEQSEDRGSGKADLERLSELWLSDKLGSDAYFRAVREDAVEAARGELAQRVAEKAGRVAHASA